MRLDLLDVSTRRFSASISFHPRRANRGFLLVPVRVVSRLLQPWPLPLKRSGKGYAIRSLVSRPPSSASVRGVDESTSPVDLERFHRLPVIPHGSSRLIRMNGPGHWPLRFPTNNLPPHPAPARKTQRRCCASHSLSVRRQRDRGRSATRVASPLSSVFIIKHQSPT